MKQFWSVWVKYSQNLNELPAGKFLKPTVLIVADEVFTMTDALLKQQAKTSVPNSVMESTLLVRRSQDTLSQKQRKE